MRRSRIAGALFAAALVIGALVPITRDGSSSVIAASAGCGTGNGPICEIGTSCTYHYSLSMWICEPDYKYFSSPEGGTDNDDPDDESDDIPLHYEP